MLKFFARNRAFDRAPAEGVSAEEFAGELFDRGHSCVAAVLLATTGTGNGQLLGAAEGFSCGVGGSGCLCGAVTGGVMALGLKGCSTRSGELVAAFRERFRATCCRSLSSGFRWRSREHLANCRQITATTAALVAGLLDR